MSYGNIGLSQLWFRWWLVAWRYQKQSWLIINKNLRHSFEGNFSGKISAIHHNNFWKPLPSITKICWNITYLLVSFRSPRGQCIYQYQDPSLWSLHQQTLDLDVSCCIKPTRSHHIQGIGSSSAVSSLTSHKAMMCDINSSSPGQNGCHFTDNIFKSILMNEKFCILIRISQRFVPKGPIDNNQALV